MSDDRTALTDETLRGFTDRLAEVRWRPLGRQDAEDVYRAICGLTERAEVAEELLSKAEAALDRVEVLASEGNFSDPWAGDDIRAALVGDETRAGRG